MKQSLLLVDAPGKAQQPNEAGLAVPVNEDTPEMVMVLIALLDDAPTTNPIEIVVAAEDL